MKPRFSSLLVAIAVAALASPLAAGQVAGPGSDTPFGGVVCGAPDVSREEQRAIQLQVERWVSEHARVISLSYSSVCDFIDLIAGPCARTLRRR